jgi:hypothetical protein
MTMAKWRCVMGMCPSEANCCSEMSRVFNEGRIRPTEQRSAANTPPPSIEEFATQFAAAHTR